MTHWPIPRFGPGEIVQIRLGKGKTYPAEILAVAMKLGEEPHYRVRMTYTHAQHMRAESKILEGTPRRYLIIERETYEEFWSEYNNQEEWDEEWKKTIEEERWVSGSYEVVKAIVVDEIKLREEEE